MDKIINNILPPLPPSVPKNAGQQAITEKVVKIPISTMNREADEIQSPIFKTRKRQQDKDKQGSSPFSIVLMPNIDKNVEKMN